jgi:hypothetical protein
MRAALNAANVKKLLGQIEKRMKTDAVGAAHYLGQSIVNDARESGNYQDHTGNLRNSVNYVVASGNDVDNVVDDRGHPEAKQESQNFGEAVKGEKNKTKLIIYAGMEYGIFVEARGYDVITQSVAGVPQKMMEAFK